MRVSAQRVLSLFLNFVFLLCLQNLHYNYVSHLVQDCGVVLPTFQVGLSSIAEPFSDTPRGMPSMQKMANPVKQSEDEPSCHSIQYILDMEPLSV